MEIKGAEQRRALAELPGSPQGPVSPEQAPPHTAVYGRKAFSSHYFPDTWKKSPAPPGGLWGGFGEEGLTARIGVFSRSHGMEVGCHSSLCPAGTGMWPFGSRKDGAQRPRAVTGGGLCPPVSPPLLFNHPPGGPRAGLIKHRWS